MTGNKNFWLNRPLSKEMLKYAVEDVLFLERLYLEFKASLSSDLFNKVLEESMNSVAYSKINLAINKEDRTGLVHLLKLQKNNKNGSGNLYGKIRYSLLLIIAIILIITILLLY